MPGQFKSRFCVANQFVACDLFGFESVWWHFFESHEGKSSSDLIGKVVKCALWRAMLRRKLGVKDLGEVIGVIKSEVQESTKKFQFFHVEEFGSIKRLTDKSRDLCTIKTLPKCIHSA